MVSKSLVGIASAIALCAGSATAFAQVGTAFTYQGQLKDAGTAVSGTVDMQFSLWTAASGGSQVGSTVTNLAVAANGGLLTTAVDFGVNPYTADQALYLQIAVRNPSGSGSYVALAARQRLTAAPFSLATRGVFVSDLGNVGIGGAAFPDNHHSLTIHGIDGHIPSVLFEHANGYNWGIGTFDGDATFGGFTIGRLGTDTPFVIDGATGNILLDSDPGSSAKVGIGTAAPEDRLTVKTASSSYGITHTDGNVKVSTVVSGATGGMGTKSNHKFSLFTNGAAAALTVDTNSSVGIGTATPATGFKLDVAGGSNMLRATLGDRALSTPTVPLTLTGANNTILFDNVVGSGAATWNLAGGGTAFFVQRSGTTNAPLWIDGTTLNVGIGTNTPPSNFKLDVAGNVRCVSLTQTSAREFKQDIVPLSNALDSIMKLRGVSYAWNDMAPEQVRGAHDIGFIADEMNAVLPDIVAKDEHGKPVGIDYGKITPVAVEAIKQLKGENDQLKARLDRLEALLAARAAK